MQNISVYCRHKKEDPMIALVIAIEENLMPVSAVPRTPYTQERGWEAVEVVQAREGVGRGGHNHLQRRTRSKT